MYKYDRALRQQAMRQRQLLLSQGLHQPCDPADFYIRSSRTPPDVKPDILQLTDTSTTPREPSRTAADVCSPRGGFYRRDGDPGRTLASVGSCPVAPPVAQYPSYPSRHHRPNCDMSASFCEMADVQTSPLTPLAGLSHMMNHVPNFVAGQPAGSLPRNFPPRNFPAAGQPRGYPGQPSCPPGSPSYQFSPAAMIRPEEFRRRLPGVVAAPSPFQAVHPDSAPPPFPPRQQSSGATVSRGETPAASRTGACETDITRSLPSPVMSYSGVVAPGSSQPSSGPYPRVLSDFVAELRRNEPDQRDVQKKLSSVLLAAVEEQRQRRRTSPTRDDGRVATTGLETASRVMEVVCKMCDQMLFMMVEWARGARFFRELRVQTHTQCASCIVSHINGRKRKCVALC